MTLDWDDYKLILHVARRGRIDPAARDLNVTASTVFRRLASIEAKCGTPIFLKSGGRYAASEDGAVLVRAAEVMERETAGVSRRLSGTGQSLSGSLTITTTEVMASFFVARHIQALTKQNPGLSLHIIGNDDVLDLTRHEADVAIRPRAAASSALYGRRLVTMRWAKYRSENSSDKAHDEATQAIGYVGEPHQAERIPHRFQDPQERDEPMLNGNSKLLHAAICANTDACAVLPTLLGDTWPGLQRIGPVLDAPVSEFWIVCHKDMRRNPRVRAVFDAMIEGAIADKNLFEGRTHVPE